MKKFLVLFLLCFASALSAAQMGDEQCPPKEPVRPCPPRKPVCPPKKRVCPPRRPMCPPKPKCGCPDKFLFFPDCKRAKLNPTPPAGPMICRDWNPYITADFIYWTIRQGGLDHAVSGFSVTGNDSRGSLREPDWKWDPGFKVGLGFNFPHDGWDMYADYTWLRTSTQKTSTSQNPLTMISLWSISKDINRLISSPPFISSSRAKWDLQFNDIHLEMGRNSYLSQFFKMRLHLGLQGAWVNQKYRVRHSFVSDGLVGQLRIKHDFWGVGLRSGIKSALQFDSNWSIYGNLALSLLWGEYDITRRDQNTTVAGVTTVNLRTRTQPYSLQPIMDLELGLRYQVWLEEGNYHFLLQAGWENQAWIFHNHYIKIPSETDHTGNLFMQGLTVRARFDF